MHRSFIAIVAVMLMGALLLPTAAGAQANKVDICHSDENGSYQLINISEKAADKHIANHGDGYPEGPVPNLEGYGYVFDANCVPEQVFPDAGCYPNVNGGLDLLFGGAETPYLDLGLSFDGSCFPLVFQELAFLVLAPDIGAAELECDKLGNWGLFLRQSLFDQGYEGMPSNAWFCFELQTTPV